MADGIEVRVENQLVRFVCPEPIGHQEMIEQLDAQPSGNVVIKALENPGLLSLLMKKEESLCMESIV